MGFNINGTSLHPLFFTDDQILIARDEYDADYNIIRKLTEIYKNAGLKVNLIMYLTRNWGITKKF